RSTLYPYTTLFRSDDIVAVIIGPAIADTGFNATARHPNRVAAPMMIAAVIVLFNFALAIDRAPEFAAPNHQCVVQQTALLEVFDQGSAGLVGVFALFFDAFRQIAVLIPATMVELDEPHAALGHAAREQTVVGEGAGLLHVRAIHFEHSFRFPGNIGEFRHGGLHPVSHFVLRDAGIDFGV